MVRTPAQRRIDRAILRVSTILAKEELGTRRRRVFYRPRKRILNDPIFGIPGVEFGQWIEILPKPASEDVRRGFEMNEVGFIRAGDVEIRVDRLAVPREILEQAEYYMADDPDAPPPKNTDEANYDILGKQVLQGGVGFRDRYGSFWLVYLRKRQITDG